MCHNTNGESWYGGHNLSLKNTSHKKQKKVPWNPSEQRHVKLLILSTQIAPFRQGFELHSSISTYKTMMKIGQIHYCYIIIICSRRYNE